MDNLLIAIEYRGPLMLLTAFLFGLAMYRIGLPPLVGFLAAGFALNALGAESISLLIKMADMGVTLLLFTIGLKLQVKTLLKPEIWAVASIHMLLVTIAAGTVVLLASLLGLALFTELDMTTVAIIGFALSFSSTVFAVKILDNSGETASRVGRIAIGILIVQDIAAVVFLAVSTGKLPTPMALGLLALPLLRRPILRMLELVGHGELLVLMGFVLALGGAQLFEAVHMKGDLGALIVGVLLSGHARTTEMAKSLLGFKELFLVAFFLNIGMSGIPDLDILIASAILLLVLPLKMMLYQLLLMRFRLRALTSAKTTLTLSNYSEFGLIVAAIAVGSDLLPEEWILAIALTLSMSFVVSAILNSRTPQILDSFGPWLKRFESEQRLPDDRELSFGKARILVVGMGRVGTAVYDYLATYCNDILGIDQDPSRTERHLNSQRNVMTGDAADPEFWSRVCSDILIEQVILVMPEHKAQVAAIEQLRARGYGGKIAATAKYPDEMDHLRELNIDAVFNIYSEAGLGFAEHVEDLFDHDNTIRRVEA